jgi:hypothetical protein
MTAPSLADTAVALGLVLRHAQAIGLPMPCGMDITDQDGPVELQFDRLAEVADWAAWLEVQVEQEKHPAYLTDLIGPSSTHAATGKALELPVRCWTIIEGAAA